MYRLQKRTCFPALFAMSYGSEVRILTKSGLQNDYNDEVPWKER